MGGQGCLPNPAGELSTLPDPCLFGSKVTFMKVFTVSAEMTYSGKLFHKFTVRTEKLFTNSINSVGIHNCIYNNCGLAAIELYLYMCVLVFRGVIHPKHP